MGKYKIVLVEPLYEGNLGMICRHMKVFGFSDLILVRPIADPKSEEARRWAMKGVEILEKAKVVNSLEDVIKDTDFLVATTARVQVSEKNYLRRYLEVREFAERAARINATFSIMFGREDRGLNDEEIERADLVVHIPASEEYPVLNLSHAATIVMYELFRAKGRGKARKSIGKVEKDHLYSFFEEIVDLVIPSHRRAQTKLAFRRVIERAMPSSWEYHRIMGVFNQVLRRLKENGGPSGRSEEDSRSGSNRQP